MRLVLDQGVPRFPRAVASTTRCRVPCSLGDSRNYRSFTEQYLDSWQKAKGKILGHPKDAVHVSVSWRSIVVV